VQFNWRVVVAEVDAERREIVLDEPLPIDLRLEWSPEVGEWAFIREVGIENLSIEFPATPYPGHLNEFGYNAILLKTTIDSWVRNVVIHNADSGIFLGGKRLTVRDVQLLSERPADAAGRQGHHGITSSFNDLVEDVHFGADFGHHITISNQSTRNVFRRVSGAGVVRLDHHRRTPIENLFTDFSSAFNYRSGGDGCQGPHAGARNTYWGMPAPVRPPCNVGGSGQCWGHIQSNVVGDLDMAASLTEDREWFEEVAALEPADLYQAQLERRLRIEDRAARFSPLRFGARDRFVEHDPTRWAVVEEGGDARYSLVTSMHDFKDGERLGEHALAETNPLGDVTITARASSPEPLGVMYRDVALILGYQDEENYDYAMFNSDEVSTEIFAVRGGQRHSIASAGRSILVDTDWHEIGFRRSGTLLEMFWDGERIASGDLAEAGFEPLPGRAGIGTYNDEALFDDIEIASPDLPPEEPDAGPDDESPASDDLATGCGCNTRTSPTLPTFLALLLLPLLRRRPS